MTFNPLYLLLILPMLLAWYAQAKVRQIYEKYSAVPNHRGETGLQIAKDLLDFHHLDGVTIERIPGYLTDHYDPQKNVLSLSNGVANGRSITSLGIVAHELGHTAQDAEGYHFMRLRTFLAQRLGVVTQFSSIAFIGGMVFHIQGLMLLSGIIMAGMLLFSLVTLPVERNASRRALDSLEQRGLAAGEGRAQTHQVLNAAALTYLANVSQRLGTFLFFVVMVGLAQGFFGR